jgi:CheY-like chemotaxis protein
MKRVLIAEDDREIRESVAELLESEGYEVIPAENGRRALEVLRAGGEQPGLILLDLMMPELDGFQFRAEQRKDPSLAGIPVLLMSAGGDLAAKAGQLGAAGYLKKPFIDIESILETVARFF